MGLIRIKAQNTGSLSLFYFMMICGELNSVPSMELKLTQSSLLTSSSILSSSSISSKHLALLAQCQTKEGIKLHESQLLKPNRNIGFTNRKWSHVFTVRPAIHFSLDTTTGSLLVLVPLIAFCIKYVLSALHRKFTSKMRGQTENTSEKHQQTSNSMRWRTVLGDSEDPDTINAESEPDSDRFSEGQEQMHFEDLSPDYTKIEDDYQKFLSDCGMSKWGNFRGGTPT